MGTIHLKIAELRKAREMTQQELGDIAGNRMKSRLMPVSRESSLRIRMCGER